MNSAVRRSQVNVDGKPELRTRAVDDLLRRIITTLFTTLITPFDPLDDEGEDRYMLALYLLRERDWAQASAEPCGARVALLARVDSLEWPGVELSRAINFTYWSLVCAYRALCEVRHSFFFFDHKLS